MAAPIEIHTLKDSLVLLTVAGIFVPLMHKLKINAIISFLFAGALLGPFGLNQFAENYPFLSYITVSRNEGLTLLGDLGVVFLLFIIGMELSIQRLITMRRLVFGLGSIQFILSSLAIGAALLFLGFEKKDSFVIGAALALSSTAIVIQFLARQKRLNSSTGRASFSILLFQDLAVIPLLFFIGFLGAKTEQNLFAGMGIALLQAGFSVVFIYMAGRLVLRPVFRLVASTESPELFVATTLLVVLGTAVATSSLGASMALGAFVAGLLISETEYSRAISVVLEPFKGLLLGLFFFTVGMGIDTGYIAAHLLLVLACVAGLILLKFLLIAPFMKLFGFSWPTAIKTGLLLGPAGEFAFVILGLAAAARILSPEQTTLAFSVATLSMGVIPFMGYTGDALATRFFAKAKPLQKAPAPEEKEKLEALVIGLRRVGTMTCEMLKKHQVRYIAIDRDPDAAESLRSQGFPAYYGNGADPLFLKECGVMDVNAIVITSHDRNEIDEVVKTLLLLRTDAQIIARAHDREHAQILYKQGVSVVVLETMEASLQISEAALLKLGRTEDSVNGTINQKRDAIRAELLAAAQAQT